MSLLKRFSAAILSVLIVCGSIVAGCGFTAVSGDDPFWAKDGKLRILAIGNSFSIDTLQYVYQIAESAGVETIEIGNLYIGGCSVETHVNNAKNDAAAYTYYQNTTGTWKTTKEYKISTALAEGNWDFISLQQASSKSGVQDSFGDLDYLINYVRENGNSDAHIIWNMTWAYQQNTTNSGFVNYNKDQMTMYNAIVSVLYNVIDTKSEIVDISPTGTAIQNARTSFMGDNLTRDGHHLSYDLGRYIAGLTFFSELTGISIENIEYAPSTVNEEQKAVAIESAMNAIAAPRTITASAYPMLDTDPHTHCVCGQTEDAHEVKGDHTAYSGVTYEPWANSALPTSGSFFLYTNIIPSTSTLTIGEKDRQVAVNIQGDLNICLNGHTITMNKTMYLFWLGSAASNNGSVFNICDCKGGGTVTNSSSITLNPAFFNISGYCTTPYTFNFYGGSYIAKNTKGWSSIFLGVYDKHTVNFYDGVYTGDTAEGYQGSAGGLIRVEGKCTVWGGTFTGSNMPATTAQGSVFYVASTGDLTINNGTIKGGKLQSRQVYSGAQYIGGTIYAGDKSTLTINGGTITAGALTLSREIPSGKTNAAAAFGSCVFSSGTVTVTGGTINGGPLSVMDNGTNSKNLLGGAICKTGSKPLTITGGTINAYEKGTTWGGAIYASDGSLNINGNPVIHGGFAYKGGAIYISGGTHSINLTEGGVIDIPDIEKLPENGGAIFVSSGTLNITGSGTITGKTTNAGSSLYIDKGTANINGATLSGAEDVSVVYTKSTGKLNLTAKTVISGTLAVENGAAVKATEFTGSVKNLATADGEDGQVGSGWDADYIAKNKIKINRKAYTYTYTDGTVTLQKRLDGGETIPGDLDDDGLVTDQDAVYLLFYTFFPEDYPVNQDCDFNKDTVVNDQDAVYLLFYTFFPEDYPIQ